MMRRHLFVPILVLAVAFVGSWAPAAVQPQRDADIIAVERKALERWGNGDPDGFLGTYADDVTYFDPTQERRVDGRAAMASLLAPLRGKIHIDRFEIVNPKVQRHGDVAVLTYNLVNYQEQPDGTDRQTNRWNSTAVFRRVDGQWRTIHSHWSYTQPELKQSRGGP